jgi:hypothetical protein
MTFRHFDSGENRRGAVGIPVHAHPQIHFSGAGIGAEAPHEGEQRIWSGRCQYAECHEISSEEKGFTLGGFGETMVPNLSTN